MQQATGRDNLSALRKKPIECAPVRWSGRLDPSGLSRPGGLLTAALQPCADEQALSLGELASALGLSDWSLSQLRIGFRPIDALDADMAEACAAFLDLPELTIRMLAELQRSYGGNPAVCDALREELAQRPRSKTELLRVALGSPPEAAGQREDAAPGPVILRCTGCQTRLRVPHLSGPGEIRCPSCQAEYAVERARRYLLQQYQPDRLGHVSPLVRKLADERSEKTRPSVPRGRPPSGAGGYGRGDSPRGFCAGRGPGLGPFRPGAGGRLSAALQG